MDSKRQFTNTFIFGFLLINLKGLKILNIRIIFKNPKFKEDKDKSKIEKKTMKKSSLDQLSLK